MTSEFPSLPLDLVQTHPGLGILRLAALLAEGNCELDAEALDAMFEQIEAGVLAETAPSAMWQELARGLMADSPAKMIRVLRACGALSKVLPEVAALFGVPQIADDPAGVDLGDHLLNTLTEAARRGAPLAVRFSLLVMNVGKADSPREHLPVHYRHIERGRPRIEAICNRFGVPDVCRELSLLALAECERVHRVSEVRAGPVALMLERVGAFDTPDLFQLLMTVCACDYCAYGGHSGQDYPKAALLQAALRACAEIDETEFATGGNAVDATQMARAAAIAQAFRSQRWSDEVT
ncbi:MAG TPA: tRNA nucleotidyltransferase [Methylocella sp.]|nr:tRNA nucleotidyltransferase [Methylocella sp.]